MQSFGKKRLRFIPLLAIGLLFGCGQDTPNSSIDRGKTAKPALAAKATIHDDGHEPHDGEEPHEGHAIDDESHAEHSEDHSRDKPQDHADENEDPGHEEEQVIRLSPDEMKEFSIEVAVSTGGNIDQYIDLPGEIVLNGDRLVHVVPRVPGIASNVYKSLGDQVMQGEVLAALESRELADAKAEFLAARERFNLAQANFKSENGLWQKKITSEKEFLQARQVQAESRIAMRSAEQKLHALGFSDTYLKELSGHHDMTYTRYEIRTPLAGTITEKHITLGEVKNADTSAFTIADLATVWVDINVYQKDLARIRKGQTVEIVAGHDIADVTGKIAWVGPIVGEETRTANARVILPNPDGNLRPGIFITARVAVASQPVDVRVPKTALQTVEDRPVVFVQTDDGFEARAVQIGRENATHVEIVSGLRSGIPYVSQGAFTLKAQLSKGAFGDGHNH